MSAKYEAFACRKPQGARATGETERLPNGAVASIWRTDGREYLRIEGADDTWFRLELRNEE